MVTKELYTAYYVVVVGGTTMGPYAEVLSEFAENLKFEDIPGKVVEKAKDHVIDTLGICLACTKHKYLQIVVDVVKGWGGKAESTILGFGDKVPCANAALANGSMAHAVDYDDTHLESVAHPSAPIVPTALAVGEAQESSGKEILTAIIAGYEIMARIGNAVPGQFHNKGFHSTSICGTFATSIVAGKLLGLNSTQMANAMGICGSLASGIFEFLTDGSWVKPIHAGWAAHAGIVAAQMAKKGLTGPHTVLEGRFGLYNTHVGLENFKKDKLIEGLGKVWETLRISIKPYPSCHFTHSSMDAALTIKRKYGIDPKDISEIICLVPQVSVNIVCEPIDTKLNPQTDYDAKFSIPFTVATILLKGKAGLDEFDEKAIKDPEILSLARKVKCGVYPNCEFPGVSYIPGWVKIVMKDGKIYEEKMRFNRGSPENPLSADELASKFFANTATLLSKEQAKKIIDAVREIEKLKSIKELIDLCTISQEAFL